MKINQIIVFFQYFYNSDYVIKKISYVDKNSHLTQNDL